MKASISASVLTEGPGSSSSPRYGSKAFGLCNSRETERATVQALVRIGMEMVVEDARRLRGIRRTKTHFAARLQPFSTCNF